MIDLSTLEIIAMILLGVGCITLLIIIFIVSFFSGNKCNFWIRNLENKRIGRVKISWLSHHFKLKEEKLNKLK